MFTPHITTACVVQANNQFLIVEETIHGHALWNQPAGHLEQGETLIEAAQRELWEETGISASVQFLLAIQQWTAPDNIRFLRFLFAIDLPAPLPTTPHDSDIDRCLWLNREQIFNADNLRSPLVAASLRCYLSGERFSLSVLQTFNR